MNLKKKIVFNEQNGGVSCTNVGVFFKNMIVSKENSTVKIVRKFMKIVELFSYFFYAKCVAYICVIPIS